MKTSHTLALSLVFGLASAPAFAKATFSEKCPDLPTCIKAVAELTGQHYLYDTLDLKGKLDATPNTEITRDNAEMLLTQVLDNLGYARVPLPQAKTYRIMKIRDARDLQLPIVQASQRQEPALPDTWDYMEMRYEATNADAVEEMCRLIRNFIPPHSSIIPLANTNKIVVTASAPVLRKAYSLFKEMDKPGLRKAKKSVD